ncbi:MAG TPA: hypothetical protein VIG62_02770 [Blastocatellia bacterium]
MTSLARPHSTPHENGKRERSSPRSETSIMPGARCPGDGLAESINLPSRWKFDGFNRNRKSLK